MRLTNRATVKTIPWPQKTCYRSYIRLAGEVLHALYAMEQQIILRKGVILRNSPESLNFRTRDKAIKGDNSIWH